MNGGLTCDYCGIATECMVAMQFKGKPLSFCEPPCHEAWRQEQPMDERPESLMDLLELADSLDLKGMG